MHPNRCLLVPGLPIPFGFPFVPAFPVLACITLFYGSSLCSCRATVRIPSSYIRIPSSFLVGYLVTSVVLFDMLLIIVVLWLVIRSTFLDSLSGEDKF